MKELTLQQLASWCGGKVAPEYEAIKVSGIQSDSRKVQPGELFLALRGERVDGHDTSPPPRERAPSRRS
ncbi:MAG: Mur ligase domain-containing protein [Oscillospiraceae bacterium]